MKETLIQLYRAQQLKCWSVVFLLVDIFIAPDAYAASQADLGSVATNVLSSMAGLAKLITATSYISGMGFAIGAVLKFKAHKDNPTQIPVGTPVALIFIAAALIFLPTIFGIAGQTLFGSSRVTGGISGVTTF